MTKANKLLAKHQNVTVILSKLRILFPQQRCPRDQDFRGYCHLSRLSPAAPRTAGGRPPPGTGALAGRTALALGPLSLWSPLCTATRFPVHRCGAGGPGRAGTQRLRTLCGMGISLAGQARPADRRAAQTMSLRQVTWPPGPPSLCRNPMPGRAPAAAPCARFGYFWQ